MSMPKFPDEALNITRDDAVNMILASIAMEELSLSHILNAEGEKIQYVLGTLENGSTPPEPPTVDQIMQVNNSVQKLLETTMYKTMFLKSKMSDALDSLQAQPAPNPAVIPVFGEFATSLSDQVFSDGGSGIPALMPLNVELAGSGELSITGGGVQVGKAGLYSISTTVSLAQSGSVNESVAIDVNDQFAYSTFRVSSGSSSSTTILPLEVGDIVSLALVSDGPIHTSNAVTYGSPSYAYTLTMYRIGDIPV
ncbi:MAG: hypothetical protein FWE34_02605 [Defluviitaleaceae bacterium]|nr:hypothetical protein [Defluviitaleaceae bacterium]